MPVPAMEIWFLLWLVGSNAHLGGEYQTEQRCRAAALYQLPHARMQWGEVSWRCERSRPVPFPL